MKKTGFTLIELVIVVSVISLIAGLSLVSVNRFRVKGRDSERKADLSAIKAAVELYFQTNRKLPCFSDPSSCQGGWSRVGSLKGLGGLSVQVMSDPIDDRRPGQKARDSFSDPNCPGYLYGVNLNRKPQYVILSRLENEDDPEAKKRKTDFDISPGLKASSSSSVTVTDGHCRGSTYNYWITG